MDFQQYEAITPDHLPEELPNFKTQTGGCHHFHSR